MVVYRITQTGSVLIKRSQSWLRLSRVNALYTSYLNFFQNSIEVLAISIRKTYLLIVRLSPIFLLQTRERLANIFSLTFILLHLLFYYILVCKKYTYCYDISDINCNLIVTFIINRFIYVKVN